MRFVGDLRHLQGHFEYSRREKKRKNPKRSECGIWKQMIDSVPRSRFFSTFVTSVSHNFTPLLTSATELNPLLISDLHKTPSKVPWFCPRPLEPTQHCESVLKNNLKVRLVLSSRSVSSNSFSAPGFLQGLRLHWSLRCSSLQSHFGLKKTNLPWNES